MKTSTKRNQAAEDRRELRVTLNGELKVIARPVADGFEIVMGPGEPDEVCFSADGKVTVNIGCQEPEPEVTP
jgi:hypothetical protein